MSGRPRFGCSTVILGIILMVASVSAFASGYGYRPYSLFSGTHAVASATAKATGIGIGLGAGGGGGMAYGGSVVNSNPRFASMAYAPPAYPTATCLKAYSGGGSGLTFGFSAGVTVVDTECRGFEAMRALVNVANNKMLDDATVKRMMMDVTCATETIARTRDCKKHLAMRESEDQPQTASANETKEVEVETKVVKSGTNQAKIGDMMPWNWN